MKPILSGLALYLPQVILHYFYENKKHSFLDSFALQTKDYCVALYPKDDCSYLSDSVHLKDAHSCCPISINNINLKYALLLPADNFAGYLIGKYFAGDNASCTKTVIASILGTAGFYTIQSVAYTFNSYSDMSANSLCELDIPIPLIITEAVSAGLLAYINYEDKTSELHMNDSIEEITGLKISTDPLSIET